jgi:hypothetical protein
MNTRIQELADEAEDYADGIVDQGGEFHQAYTQKLAELIVRECAGVGYDASYYECALNVSNKIKEHFGVEE